MKTADTDCTLSMIEPPADLAQQTEIQQANSPYFGLGFRKERLDEELYEMLLSQFRAAAPEFRIEGQIREIVNARKGEIAALYHEDREFNQRVSQLLQPAHEAWAGMALLPSACYGFRVYQRGTYLHNHVDVTASHIISSTICVDYRLDSPWPLYIEDIEGRGYQVDIKPGEFVFYEGSQLIHGRPYPLDGDYYAGMYVHYRPADMASMPTPLS